MVNIVLEIGGKKKELAVDEDELLVDVLRIRLGLLGVKKGCEEGERGACSILMNGKLVNSCLVLAAAADGASIMTIETLGWPGRLHQIKRTRPASAYRQPSFPVRPEAARSAGG